MIHKNILQYLKKNKSQTRFVLVFVVLIGTILFGVYSALSEKFESVLNSNQIEKEQLVFDFLTNEIVSSNVGLSVEKKERIHQISSANGVKYLLLQDQMDSVIIELSLAENGNIIPKATLRSDTSTPTNDYFRIKKTLVDKESKILILTCDFSRAELTSSLERLKTKIGLILITVMILSMIALTISSLILIKPLNKIANEINEISQGNFSKRINYKGKNEFSEIAYSINLITDNLQKSNAHIEKLNKELKFQFRDKIGELNYEINQRRQAEHSLQQSEEQFRLLFEMAPIGMVISSISGRILKVNKAFHTILGYEEDELLKKKIKDLTLDEDKDSDIKYHEKLINGFLTNAYYEKRLIRKDGKVIYVIVEAVLVNDKSNKPLHIIEQVIDITERKRVEKELIFAKEKAEESDRLKGAFLAQMSHEIRTPLNVILTAMNLIEDEVDNSDEDTKLILESVASAGKRLQRTINLILDISAVQSGSYSHQFEDIDLNKELHGFFTEFKSIATEKGLQLSFVNKTSSSLIFADKYSVTQIFQNLIDNAIKYTLKGKVDIVLEDWSNERLQVVVQDTGIGISKSYISNLFSPFSQEDVGQKREFEGNGLGLALVKKYCDINNAEILVDSIKDKGSTFSVIFLKKKSNGKYISSERLNLSKAVDEHVS